MRRQPHQPEPRPNMACYQDILDIASVTIDTLEEIGVNECCFVGGMACRLYTGDEGRQLKVRHRKTRVHPPVCNRPLGRILTSFASPHIGAARRASSNGFAGQTINLALPRHATQRTSGLNYGGTPIATKSVSGSSRLTSSYQAIWISHTSLRTTSSTSTDSPAHLFISSSFIN